MARSRGHIVGVTGKRLFLAGLLLAAACDATTVLTDVGEPIPASVDVSPDAASLPSIGDTVRLVAVVFDADGAVLPSATVSWSSSDTAVATVTGSGLVRASADGEVDVVASAGDLAASARVTVRQVTESITWDSAAITLIGGDTLRVTPTAFDLGGSPVATPGFTWSSTDTLVATVEATGLIRSRAPGTAEVRVTSMARTAALGVTVIARLELVDTAVADGVVGTAYTDTLAATGGSGDRVWSVEAGSLPAGLALDGASGVISGTPTGPGASAFTARVASEDGQELAVDLALVVHDQLVVTTTDVERAIVDSAYSAALEASGGTGSYSWTLASGALPGGIALDSAGMLSGAPETAGTSTFTARVASEDGQTATVELDLDVVDRLVVTTAALRAGAVGVIYADTLLAAGGSDGVAWSVVTGALPAGITLDGPTGVLGGTPTAPDSAVVMVEAVSGDGQTADAELTLLVRDPLVVTTTTLDDALVDSAYTATLTAQGGGGGYDWSIENGVLPDGLTLDPAGGVISGTATVAGTELFSARVTSADGQSATAQLELRVRERLRISTTSLPGGSVGDAYSETLEATGGDGSYLWTLESGALPSGLSLGATGVIDGVPLAADTTTFTVEVTSAGEADTREYTIAIGTCSLDSTPDSDSDGLPDCAETATNVYVGPLDTGTDPLQADTDGDGLSDGDEVLGAPGLDLPALGATPLRKDILVEYDWFDDALGCAPHTHRPTTAQIAAVTAMFDASPVPNPDGTTGVNFIHDYGQGGVYTGGNLIPDADGVLSGGVGGSEFTAHKSAHLDTARRGYFHYVILPHRYNTTSGSSGQAEINGDDMIVSLQCSVGSTSAVANTIAHELGHNLGLRHGGDVNTNWKPNYNSVMNYRYQFPGVDDDCTPPGNGVLDYSHGTRISLDENALEEADGVCGAPPGPAWDWNDDGDTVDSGLVFDINQSDGLLQVLTDHDDWSALYFGGLAPGLGLVRALEIVSCLNHPEHEAPFPP